jgi:hypothetical protein
MIWSADMADTSVAGTGASEIDPEGAEAVSAAVTLFAGLLIAVLAGALAPQFPVTAVLLIGLLRRGCQ